MLAKVVISFLSVILAICAHENSNAVKYNADSFQQALDNKSLFVMFFAPWCGHCKRLAPTWEQLAEMYNNKNEQQVEIAKVDCTVDTEFCGLQEITGYPTVKFFKNQDKSGIKYKGSRSLDDFVSFLTEQLKEPIPPAAEEGKPETPTVEVGSSLVELTEENMKDIVSRGSHFVKFYAPWCSHCQRLAPVWEALADTFKLDPSVNISKIDCTAHREVCRSYEVKGYPTLIWIQDGKIMEKYQGPRTHDSLKEFVVQMKLKSTGEEEDENEVEKTLPDEDDSVVVPFTGDNFVNGVSAGVTFVKFFAPWCGHCKRLAPLWEDLALKFVNNPNVKVAKVDCTTEVNGNLCKEFDVSGYPTLLLFKNGVKQDEYTGARDLNALYSFVMSHVNRDEL